MKLGALFGHSLKSVFEDWQKYNRVLSKCLITSHLSEWLLLKRPQIANADKDAEKCGPLYAVSRDVNWCTLENSMEVPQKTKNRTTI